MFTARDSCEKIYFVNCVGWYPTLKINYYEKDH